MENIHAPLAILSVSTIILFSGHTLLTTVMFPYNANNNVCFRPFFVDTTIPPPHVRSVHSINNFSNQCSTSYNNSALACCVIPRFHCQTVNTTCHCHHRPCVSYRRKRGGMRKQRNIQTVIRNRIQPPPINSSVNQSNLITIKCKPRKVNSHVNKSNIVKIKSNHTVDTAKASDVHHSILKLLYMNSQSSRNKAFEINDLILEYNADLVFVTETWFKPGDEAIINDLVPNGFKILSVPRLTKGGGTAIVYKSCLSVTPTTTKNDFTSFEHCAINVKSSTCSALFVCVYRPPPSKTNGLTTNQFIDEFSNYLEALSNEKNVFMLGDFNLHYEKLTDPAVKSFKTLIDEHNFSQLVTEPTRKKHILDLLLIRGNLKTVSDIEVVDKCLSDHCIVSCDIDFERPRPVKHRVLTRNVKEVNVTNFRNDILSSFSCDPPSSFEDLNATLKNTLDKHAPLRERVISAKPGAPWMSLRVKAAKADKRKAERAWKKSGLEIHKQIYQKCKRETYNIVKEEKRMFINEKIVSSGSCKELYQICNDLVGKGKDKVLPTIVPKEDLPQAINNFFIQKVVNIRKGFDNDSVPTFEEFNGIPVNEFRPVSESTVKSFILKSSKKFSILDPLPASLFFDCIDVLLSVITRLINDSLASGNVPVSFHDAIVHPLLKKSGMDQNLLKNYRPVSNLPFLSKILEKIVLTQLNSHLVQNGLKDVYQSAYKSKHSTETALLKVNSDLLNACDSGKVSVLALLDLSAAFDTIDHDILLMRLNTTFGIRSFALKWFESYLLNRHQTVIADGVKSDPACLLFGVPQGSVLGPVLFTLYAQPLSLIIEKHGFSYHRYADDTQIYRASDVVNVHPVIDSLCNCISDVSTWMSCNKLKLNEDKTEIMLVGSNAKVKAINIHSVFLCGETIKVANEVKNLGVYMDQNLSMDKHISYIRKICYLELRKIAHLRPYLTIEATNKLVCSFVSSRLDYCNSLFGALQNNKIARLQQIQNHAARIVSKTAKREHISPILKELHWLPVKSRVEYKIASLTFQSLNDPYFPPYLKDLLKQHVPSRSLRSSTKNILVKPRAKLKTFGQRAFTHVAPDIWNLLPDALKQRVSIAAFKSMLKTHLFVY